MWGGRAHSCGGEGWWVSMQTQGVGVDEEWITELWCRTGGAGELQLVAGRRRRRSLREREGEVKTLAEALKGQEGVRGKVSCGHLTVGLLVASRWTLALKAADQQVHTGASVLADPRHTAAWAGRQLAAFSWRWIEERKGSEMRIHITYDKAGIPSGTPQCYMLFSVTATLLYVPLHKSNTSYQLINTS